MKWLSIASGKSQACKEGICFCFLLGCIDTVQYFAGWDTYKRPKQLNMPSEHSIASSSNAQWQHHGWGWRWTSSFTYSCLRWKQRQMHKYREFRERNRYLRAEFCLRWVYSPGVPLLVSMFNRIYGCQNRRGIKFDLVLHSFDMSWNLTFPEMSFE